MPTSLQVAGVGFALAVTSLTPTAAAEPKDEVAAATAAWAQALGEDDPEKVLPFYSNAVLLGTISPKLIPIRQRCGITSWPPSRLFPD